MALISGCATVQPAIQISAPAGDVNSIPLGFAGHPAWDPFIINIQGAAAD
jgi:hypothetical protein